MKKVLLMFSVLLSLVGVTQVKAQKALPYSYGFEDYNLATDGWTKLNPSGKNDSKFLLNGTSKKTGSYGFQFNSYDTSGDNTQYLISPELIAPNGGNVSFYYKNSKSGYAELFKVGYSTTDAEVSSFTWGDEISKSDAAWEQYEGSFPAGTKYVAVYYYSNYQYYLYVDDFSFTAATSGPALAVADGKTAIATGYTYNFGLATAGATKEFKLSNPGTESITVDISATNGFGVNPANATIEAKGETTLTVTMADATANGEVKITPTVTTVDAFTINVSGTIRDANKVYEYGFAALPDEWTTTGSWYHSETNGAYTTVWYLSSEARLISPKLTIAEGETFYVEAKGYSTSNTSYQHLQMQYSADGTTWTNFGDEPSLDPSNWKTFAFTGSPAGKYYIAINASQADVRMFYGGELPNEPKMVVTQPTSLDFGVIAETTDKTFTIANTGKAELKNISVVSSNSTIFAVKDAPTSLAAGASAEVTITMAATSTGVLSSDITVSAEGFTEDAAVKFTVTGVVLPEGMAKEEFTDGLPANWTNASWTFADGEATGKSSSAYLTTAKLIVSEGDLLVIKAKRSDSDSSDRIDVQVSDNGSTFTTLKSFSGSTGLTYPDYATLVVTDIPTTTKYIRFVGFYVVVDEIAGLTYAPVLSVTKGGEAVATPAEYDFQECAADADVTYNFANAGAGSINITNVAITGDGAAAYSTNWTESVAAPFDLKITRTYDADRTEAAAAVVTVTTSEGDFVINVTGTDKAANAPELAVSTNALDFGKLSADDEKEVTVTNNGTGLMTVDIVSDNEAFVVSPAQLTEIGAGQSKTFKVTFKYGEPYGVKDGNITVTPTYSDEAVKTITVTGRAKDPNAWSEDFAANELPTGWDAGADWTIAEGVAKAAYKYGSTTYLTTPPLTVSGATDELVFDYKSNANYVSVKIQMSKDGGAFADYKNISLNKDDAGIYTITGLEAGDYQFRFANDDYELDNFEGFKLNLPDHMAAITAYTIPASSDVTMKVGESFEATVTVKESRGVAEELTAKLYMGEEVIGTATGAVEANGTETLTITATPTVAATEGAQMHIEVEWAGATMKTKEVTRYVKAPVLLTLDESSSEAFEAGTYDKVTLNRTFAEGWNTIVLPFAIPLSTFGAEAQAYAFTGYTTEGAFKFAKVTSASLNVATPYVIYVPEAITEPLIFNNITISSLYLDGLHEIHDNVLFQGTYKPMAAGDMDSKMAGLTPDGRIHRGSAKTSIKGFRAYFDTDADRASVKSETAQQNIDTGAGIKYFTFDDATGIREVGAEADGQVVYNMAGQHIQKAQRGISIVNGKKIVVK